MAYIDPRFEDEGSCTSADDHPHADIRNGEVFLNQIYDAVRNSPNWSKTVLIINYDEWGGFYDHVPPPLAPIPTASAASGDTDGRLGFRVPCVVISPYARRGFITGSVSSTSTNGNQVLINLTGVTNAQTIQVTLVAVNDGTATSDVSIPMSILIGDVNASGLVDGNDVSPVQADTRQTANSTNFRLDVNTSGLIDGNDVSLVQSNTRTSLP